MAKFSGGCACGAIRYETDAEPVLMLNCHCRDCQQASGSAYAALVVVPKASLKLTGTPRYREVMGTSGHPVGRGFCAECGSPLALKMDWLPDLFALQAGSLDDPSRFKPAMDIYTASAQPWDHMHPDLPKRPQGVRD
jgi:hypothetical protein